MKWKSAQKRTKWWQIRQITPNVNSIMNGWKRWTRQQSRTHHKRRWNIHSWHQKKTWSSLVCHGKIQHGMGNRNISFPTKLEPHKALVACTPPPPLQIPKLDVNGRERKGPPRLHWAQDHFKWLRLMCVTKSTLSRAHKGLLTRKGKSPNLGTSPLTSLLCMRKERAVVYRHQSDQGHATDLQISIPALLPGGFPKVEHHLQTLSKSGRWVECARWGDQDREPDYLSQSYHDLFDII